MRNWLKVRTTHLPAGQNFKTTVKKIVQKMQKEMEKIQAKLEEMTVEGTAGGGMATFNYTGSPQNFVVPVCAQGTVGIQAFGAQGGANNTPGGMGGLASGELAVTTGATLFVYVGGKGLDSQSCNAAGGYNGHD